MNFVDNEELADRSMRQRRKQKRDLVWNVLTGIAVIATVTLIGMLALIFSNPHIGLNPFPPPTMPVLIDLSTKTPTLVYLPPTWTPTARSTETPKGEATATSDTQDGSHYPGSSYLCANLRQWALFIRT